MDQRKIPVLLTILGIQLFLLFIANVWNAWIIIKSSDGSNFYNALDFFWPIAETFLLVTAMLIMDAKNVNGWKKYIPFVVAFLLNAGSFLLYILSGRNNATMVIGGVYSIIALVLLGYVMLATFATPATESLKEKYESNRKYMLAIN